MAALKDDIAAYEAMRSSLEADHLGKWALVRDRKLVGLFEEFEAVAAAAVERFGRGPYLIRRIGVRHVSLPAHLMFKPLNVAR